MTSPASRPVPPAAANPLNLRGAVDLSALKQRPAPAAGRPGRPPGTRRPSAGSRPPDAAEHAGRPLRVDITEANFQELVELSAQVPVVVALWAAYSPGSAELVDVLERIVDSYDGQLVLGAADVEVFPQLAQAFQVQAVPTAVAARQGPAGAPVPGRRRRTAGPQPARRTAQGRRRQRRDRTDRCGRPRRGGTRGSAAAAPAPEGVRRDRSRGLRARPRTPTARPCWKCPPTPRPRPAWRRWS